MSSTALPLVCEPRTDLTWPDVIEAVLVGQLLADATRASILRMLRAGPHCVCELATTLGEQENNVSNHLARLRGAGLVRARRHDRNARFLYFERDEAACAAALARLNEIMR
jgi:DNA-binding transcriptional ArsR family regulator